MDPKREYLNNILYNIVRDDFPDIEMQYIIDGLTAIKNKDKIFKNSLLIEQEFIISFKQYRFCDHQNFQANYRSMDVDSFRKAYLENYHTYFSELAPQDMEVFDWNSEFK